MALKKHPKNKILVLNLSNF